MACCVTFICLFSFDFIYISDPLLVRLLYRQTREEDSGDNPHLQITPKTAFNLLASSET
jgi:hypothetical protein